MKKIVFYFLSIAIILAVFASPFASSFPDGLEHVAERLGFMSRAVEGLIKSPIPDYSFPGIKGNFATSLAGLAGVFITFGLAYSIGLLLAKKHKSR